MVWLFLVGLGVWILVLQSRLAAAERQLRGLQPPRLRPTEAAPTVSPLAAPIAAPEPGAARPLPPVSTLVDEPVRQPTAVPPRPPPTRAPIAEVAARPPATRAPGPALSTWLSENGLAWVGGGALVLGGALLVAYAAERGFFTPPLRIAAALVLGAAMLAVGEWLRRLTGAPGGRPALAAAIVSGAGASTLYAGVWAAYALYDYLPLTAAAVLLAAISLGLLALAVLHGEALALLALAGAFAAPILCRQPSWSDVALDGYLALITVTGLAAVALRNWGWAGLLTLALAAVWIFDREAIGDARGAGGLIVAALAFTLLAVRRSGVPGAPAWDPGTGFSPASLPTVSCVGASLLWALIAVHGARETFVIQALLGAAVTLLCAAGARMNLVRSEIIAAPAAALILTAAAHFDVYGAAPMAASPMWYLIPVAALAASTLALRLAHKARVEVGVIGAVGCALTLTLLRGPVAAALAGDGWLVFALAAALYAAGAVQIARRSSDAASDVVLAAWAGAGAEAVGLAIHTALAGRPEPLAYGLLALALALTARRLDWRGLPEAAALAALVSLLSVLGGGIAGDALAGRLAWTGLALAGAAGVLAQSAAWWMLRGRPGATAATEAISTSAIIAGLLTAFLLLRLWATPRGAHVAPLDEFTEAALRTVLLITAGLVLTLRGGPGVFSRARGPVFLVAGALHGVVLGMLYLNPWWGPGRPTILVGPPVFDGLALAYLAPALLLAAAACRQVTTLDRAAPWTALAALGFLIVWAAMEVRRLFHGPDLASGPFGYGEVAAYGAVLVALAWVVTMAVGRIVASADSAAAVAGVVAKWIALFASAWLLCEIASPWWGPLEGAFAHPALFFALFSGAIVLTALFARQAATAATAAFREAIKVAVTLEAFVVLTLAIRFVFHGAAMRVSLHEASVETWTFSAAWAVYGLIILATGARGGDRALRWLGLAVLIVTTLKVFLFDMATLQGVIRAGSFLALGVLLLIGAVAARRLGAGARASR